MVSSRARWLGLVGLAACTSAASIDAVAPDAAVPEAAAPVDASVDVEMVDAEPIVDATPDVDVDAEVSASSSSGSSGTSGNTSSGSGGGGATFTDDFDRANGAVGNGWSAKTDHFAIDSDQLLQTGSADDGYYNIELFRPDRVLDVQIDVDLTFPTTDTAMSAAPTIGARIPESTLSTYDSFDGYTLYLYRNSGAIGRDDANADTEDDLATAAINPPIAMGAPVHATFIVTGTSPVTLTARVTRADGSVALSLSASDASANRFPAAGHTSLGGNTEALGVRWDNYVRQTLP